MDAPAIVIACDLDRTLLPNGEAHESPLARPLLRALVAHSSVVMVYVSGRSRQLQQAAVERWTLPVPAFAAGDVGTTLYEVGSRGWRPIRQWSEQISHSWQGADGAQVMALLAGVTGLEPQPQEQQGRHKASYYTAGTERPEEVLSAVRGRLAAAGLDSHLVWSVDEALGVGLLDVIPARASKTQVVRFLLERLGVTEDNAVFAGDSGNDLDALASGLQAVLVANASDEVRREAVELASRPGSPARLYLARGGFLGMNGNYAAGVLEGVAHFVPEADIWLRAASSDGRLAPGVVSG